jgi:phenylalanyl-tRNA synthetase alpha chain
MSEVDLKQLKIQAENEVVAAKTMADLDLVFYKYLGKKGQLKLLFRGFAKLPESERKQLGVEINILQKRVENLVTIKKTALELVVVKPAAKAEDLGFTMPKIGHLHPITQTIRMMNKIFIAMGYSVMEGPEIESDGYNFRRLNVPPDHPARDMQDTIYIKEPDFLLRTHTSSVEARILAKYKPPLKVVCPGRVYRNEKVNKSNHFIFHHYQGLVVLPKVSLKDLFGTLNFLFKKMYGPKTVIRYRNKYYPEVEPGVGSDMLCFACQGKGCPLCKGVGWIEMGGAGIVHPNLLKIAGINSQKWMGFAFGLGLDRWVMAKYKINDIRTLLGGNLAYKYFEGENTLS